MQHRNVTQVQDTDTRAARFETHRPHLRAVATRLLGSPTEADDAVQEAWLRFDRAGDEQIENLGGWLTTVVSRICLDHLRARSTRSEDPVAAELLETSDDDPGPEDATILAESTAVALAVVLDALTPIERVVFVLHDVFAVPFEEIAAVVDRTPVAARQIASRARRRVRPAADAPDPQALNAQRELVSAFFDAARNGRLETLLHLLAPDVVVRADAAAVALGTSPETVGARAVAEWLSGRAAAARLAQVDLTWGAVWLSGGRLRVVFRFTTEADSIVAIELIGDPETHATLDLEIEPPQRRARTGHRTDSTH